MQGKIDQIFLEEANVVRFLPDPQPAKSHFEVVCDFLRSVVTLCTPQQKAVVLDEIRDRMSRVHEMDSQAAKAAHALVQMLVAL
jgi:hypothetical protein